MTRKCPNCGMPVPSSASICPYCHFEIDKHYGKVLFWVLFFPILIPLKILGWILKLFVKK